MKADLTFQFMRSGKQWRFRILAANGDILVHSERYKRKRDCVRAVMLIRDNAHAADFRWPEGRGP